MESKDLSKYIRTIPDFPKKGIMFRDITTLINNEEAFSATVDQLIELFKDVEFDRIAGIESRGFIFGAAMAYRLRKPFVLIRKKGKLPHKTERMEYQLEYGTDVIEAHIDAINPGEKILIIDDLLATGGTAEAAAKLMEKMGGKVVGLGFVIALPELKGIKKVEKYNPRWLVEFEGE